MKNLFRFFGNSKEYWLKLGTALWERYDIV